MADYKKVMKTVLVVLLLLTGLLMAMGPYITKYTQGKYYKKYYGAEEINPADLKDHPASFRIKGMTRISFDKQYFQPAALQMIAAKHGVRQGIGYFNFLMGFTYGMFYRPDMPAPMFTNDPILGFKYAAPFLGLKMKFLITDDRDVFLKAVKFHVSRDHPVVIEVDAGALRGETVFIAHPEVIAGYSEKGFEYMEADGRVRPGAGVLTATSDSMVAAMLSQSKAFMSPRKFSIIIFEPAEEKKTDLGEVFKQNGESLTGKKYGVISVMGTGSFALQQFSAALKKKGMSGGLSLIEPAPYMRADNASFLLEYFPADEDIKNAAAQLKEAGAKYVKVLELLKSADKARAEEASGLVNEAAALEKSAGEIFLKKAGVK